jgi:Secretion system C-terminal sorting domain
MKKLLQSAFMSLLLCGAMTTKAQVPLLNSYPSASAVIFLDFDGQTVPAGAWYGTPIVCAPSGLTNVQITEAFNRVAEDYRPFNINITTDSTKYFAAPLDKRMRVIVTPTYAWYGSAGGVAFVGSFIWGDDTPCFVFSVLLSYNPKNVAEASSHEAGHTLGLYHQSTYDGSCVKTAEYNPGVGTGEIGWAPIMGVGYSKNLTLWNNGPNSNGCGVMQSDLDIIIDPTNGFTYRTDDYGNNFAGATNVPFVSNAFNVTGVVEKNTDADFFKVTMSAYGRFQLNAVPYNVGSGNSGSDLDMQVSLYNNAQVLLGVYNPGTLLSSVIDSFLNAGIYYLKVEGKGNIYAPNYASLGSYSLQGNFTSGSLPLRKLELSGTLNNDEHQLHWIIDADEQVTKQILEISTDGRNFTRVTEPAIISRSYTYSPHVNGVVLYRLNVTFDNGHQYYSNTITLGKTGTSIGPKLISNLFNTGNIEVSSPGVYNYSIYDLNGKTLVQGKLTNGSNIINTGSITSGMYLVRFTNGTEQYIEKMVRQ